MPLLAVDGRKDTTVPVNNTRFNKEGDEYPLSYNGYFYTSISDIASAWTSANGCLSSSDTVSAYSTGPSVEGSEYGLSCLSHGGSCTGGDVVTCSWDG